jgi:hypothetical protein
MSVRSQCRAVALAALTPLLEKNVIKTIALDVPVVFSMSRLVVLTFAVAMLRQLWRVGAAGWPDATLAIAIVLALPLLGALERVDAGDVVALARVLVRRFGVGDVPRTAVPDAHPSSEPSKYDDHRSDGR